MGLHVPSYTSTCRESQLYTPSNVYSFGGSLTAGFCSRIWPDEVFISTMRSRPACFSVLFIGRHRSTTLTHSSALSLDITAGCARNRRLLQIREPSAGLAARLHISEARRPAASGCSAARQT